MEGFHYFKLDIFGFQFSLSESIIEQWVIMAFIMILALIATRKLETIPKGAQKYGELIVEMVNNIVRSTMGEKFLNFAPYIGTLAIFLLTMNIFGMTGFEPPTADYSIALSLALVSFVVIQTTTIKRNGPGHYLIAFAKPLALLTPLNIIERLVVPVSLSLRLFGNIYAAAIIMHLIKQATMYLSEVVHLGIASGHFHMGIFQLGVLLPFNLYFDIFDGALQMIIFTMLTMIFIKTTSEH